MEKASNKLRYPSTSFIFQNLINCVYERIFHEKMENETIKFSHDLFYLFIATAIATVFSSTFNILAGRILGPSEYGKYAMVQSIGMFLYIPMMLGISTAMVKYAAEDEDYNRQKRIISTAYIITLILSLVSLLAYWLCSDTILIFFSITPEIYILALGFALIFVIYTMTTNTLRGLHKMKMLSVLKPIYSICILFYFILFTSLNVVPFKSVIFSTYLAYGTISLIIAWIVRKFISVEFDKEWAKILNRYGLIASFSGISFILYTNIDQIYINRYMSVLDVGIYNAYKYASIDFIAIFSGILVTVLFPVASKHKNKKRILDKLNKLMPYMFFVGFPFVLFAEFVILRLYGKEYPFNIYMMLMFAFTAILIAGYSTYAWIFNSQGEKGVKITLLGTGTIAVVNVILDSYFVPMFGIYGAMGATSLAYCVGILVVYKRSLILFK